MAKRLIINTPGMMLLISFVILNLSGGLLDFIAERQNLQMNLSEKAIIMQLLVFLPVIVGYCLIQKQNLVDAVLAYRVEPSFFPFILTVSLWLPMAFTISNMVIPRETNAVPGYFSGNTELSVMAACIIPAVMEEIFFRGAVLKLLSKGGAVFSILVSSLFFALFHNNFHHFLWPFLAGLTYGFMAITFQSVWPSMFAHTVNNLFSYYAYGILLHFKQDNGLIIVLSIIIAIFLILTFSGLSQYQELLAYEELRRQNDRTEASLQRQFAMTTFFSLPVMAVIAMYIQTALH